MQPEILIDVRARLGEGPRWDAERSRLLWVDIEPGELHVWDGAEDRKTACGARVGAAAPTTDGETLVALAHCLAFVAEDGSIRAAHPFPHSAELRTNDGACDPQGRFWVGSMRVDERGREGALYRYDGRELVTMVEGIGLSNGLDWSPDRSLMYYVDTPTQRIDVFDYDGEIANRRPFVEIAPEDGFPDGLAVDDEGGVWLALWGGHAVRRYGADGRLEAQVELPAAHVTACCFGGPTRRTLFITTAAPDGRLYVVEDAGVAGPPATPFRSTAPSDAEPTSAR